MASETRFAPPEREERQQALAESRRLGKDSDLQLLLRAVPDCAAILNDKRQVLLANGELLGLLGAEDLENAVGSRPGEAVGCIHAWDSPAGCGTSESCRYCGAAQALVAAVETGRKTTHECRITASCETETEWLDLLVTALPIEHEGSTLVLLTLSDISDLKRRRALERIFFHDVLNSASALYGLLQMAHDFEEGDVREELGRLVDLGGRLIDEITSQRDLLAAESGELNVQPRPVDIQELLLEAASQFRSMTLDEGKELVVEEGAALEIITDQRLLFRIITNMLKNALEASGEGSTVTAGAEAVGEGARVWVRNPGWMPREVQLQVFQRSFSTKGAGRGIGTYSMKLIGERYLKGEVSFESDEVRGTEFSITLPPA